MEAILVAALVLVVIALLVLAPLLSEALVGVCARRLPRELAFRMHEEWVAELGAISTRLGKLAFALSLTATRRRAFPAASAEDMPEVPNPSGSFLAVASGWYATLALPTIVFAVVANVISWQVPDIYESQATIMVVPQQVPAEYVPSTVMPRIEDRIQAIQHQIMSRTQLERMILDFNLYREERKRGIMEDIVEKMRGDMTFMPIRGDAIVIRFRGRDPRIAMRTTERLASMFIDASLRDREVLADGTIQFMEAQLEELARDLHAHATQRARVDRASHPTKEVLALEHEVLRDRYRSLYTKTLDAKSAAFLDRRQIGETFKILDAARMPSRPISPNRLAYTAIGALVGAAVGGMALAGFYSRRRPALAS